VRLGFAVKVLGEGGLPSHDTRRWQSGPHLRHSLAALDAILAYCERHGIGMYRMTAALAPYATHPDLPQFHRQVEECREALAATGARARAAGVRLSTHPSQYIVLNSEDPDVRAAAARDVEMQAALLDAMELEPGAVCVLHVGGAAGGIGPALDRFEAGLATLSERARERLVIENEAGALAAEVEGILESAGIRARADLRNEKITFKIREHSLQKLPYQAIVGEKEVASRSVAVRTRGGVDLGQIPIDAFVARLRSELSPAAPA